MSVCQGFLNKKTMGQMTEITEMCFLTVLEAGMSRIKVLAALVSGEASSLHCPSMAFPVPGVRSREEEEREMETE